MTRSPTLEAARPPFDAVIFDLDGVVTDTAAVHEAAWRELFDIVLRDPRVPSGADTSPFSRAEYRLFVDGRPREEGVLAFLSARGVAVPRGDAEDPADSWTAFGLGARKDALLAHRRVRDVTSLEEEIVPPSVGARTGELDATLVAEAETIQSRIRIAVALRNRLTGSAHGEVTDGRVGALHFHEFAVRLDDGQPVCLTKTAAFATSRDHALSSARTGAAAVLRRSPGSFAELLAGRHSHVEVFDERG